MKNELTRQDIEMMRAEMENIRLNIMPGVIEEVKRTRAFGDLSENDEYKTAKREQNHYRSRMRYLEGMIKTAKVIDDRSGEGEVGLYDKVEIFIPEDGETETISVVTTACKMPMTIVCLPVFLSCASRNSLPIENAIKPSATSETMDIPSTASPDVKPSPAMPSVRPRRPRQYGPTRMPATR